MLNQPMTGLLTPWSKWPKLKEVPKSLNGIEAAGSVAISGTSGMDQETSVMLRFGPKYTSAMAVNAVSDLKQQSKESCAGFLNKVFLAINKHNSNIAEADKRTPQYLRVFDASIMSHFGAGLKDEIGKAVLGAATPPGSVEEMRQSAKAIKSELAKIGQPGTSALAVQEEPAQPEMDQMSEIA